LPLDYTYRIQLPHRPGSLARVAGTIADGDGLIGDVNTISVGRVASVREITLEVRDRDHAENIEAMLETLPGVEVLWARDRALLRHEGGKLTIESTTPVRTVQDMRDVYTPGVARACLAISENPSLAGELTMIGRSVAICTNGTRVLGLGDIGPVASMPVMEGKAVFYHQLAHVSAMPVLIDTRDVDEFVETVMRIAPTFGGIHLEDISAPECFEIEARLIEALDKPVMHDDVHGRGDARSRAGRLPPRGPSKRRWWDRSGSAPLGSVSPPCWSMPTQSACSARTPTHSPTNAPKGRALK
jgi:malate dehydrogenase (oxaloacetate-decarboxylating)